MAEDPRDILRREVSKAVGGMSADTSYVEDKACRAALREVDCSAGLPCSKAGIPASSRLTFALLRETLEFPGAPAVTGVLVEGPNVLFGRFRSSSFWQAWVAAWDDRPEMNIRSRVMVFDGPMWGGICVAYHGIRPERPHAVVGYDVVTPIVIERIRPWVRSLSWRPGE